MNRFLLDRFLHTETETVGALYFNNTKLYVIERAWIPESPGGLPFTSCVPEGTYQLLPHTRPNGDAVLALVNPGLAVYRYDQDRTNSVGRYLILIHAANYAQEVNGCLAPGMGREKNEKGNMVTDSRKAMKLIMKFAGNGPAEIKIF